MNALLEGNILIKLMNMSISAGFLILAVLLSRLLLAKAPKWIRLVLWGLVALRLLMPVSFRSIFSLIPSEETIPQNIVLAETPVIHSGIPAVNSTVNPYLQSNFAPRAEASVNPLQIVFFTLTLLWLLGILAFIAYMLIAQIVLRRRLCTAVRTQEGFYESDRIDSPFVFGIFRPRIYLPFALPQKYREPILAHEKTHIRHLDPLLKALAFTLLALYWFHPLVWVSYFLFTRDLELACDERVVRDMDPASRADYSEALLLCSAPEKHIFSIPVAFGETRVKSRIRAALNYKKPAFWILTGSAVLLTVLAVCFLTNPRHKQGTPTLWYDVSENLPGPLSQDNDGRFLYFTADEFPNLSFVSNVWSGIACQESEVETPLFRMPLVPKAWFCDLNGDSYPELCAVASNVYQEENGYSGKVILCDIRNGRSRAFWDTTGKTLYNLTEENSRLMLQITDAGTSQTKSRELSMYDRSAVSFDQNKEAERYLGIYTNKDETVALGRQWAVFLPKPVSSEEELSDNLSMLGSYYLLDHQAVLTTNDSCLVFQIRQDRLIYKKKQSVEGSLISPHPAENAVFKRISDPEHGSGAEAVCQMDLDSLSSEALNAFYESDDKQRMALRTFRLSAFPDYEFNINPGEVWAVRGGQEIVLSDGMPIENVYTADVNGDGYPEVCVTSAFGSGLINEYVTVTDLKNRRCWLLFDRETSDYHLYMKDGMLFVQESPVMKVISPKEETDNPAVVRKELKLSDWPFRSGRFILTNKESDLFGSYQNGDAKISLSSDGFCLQTDSSASYKGLGSWSHFNGKLVLTTDDGLYELIFDRKAEDLVFLKKESTDWPPSENPPKNKALFLRTDNTDGTPTMEDRTNARLAPWFGSYSYGAGRIVLSEEGFRIEVNSERAASGTPGFLQSGLLILYSDEDNCSLQFELGENCLISATESQYWPSVRFRPAKGTVFERMN